MNTDGERKAFINGYDWTLYLLRVAGIPVDQDKLMATMRELADGTMTGMNSLEDRISDNKKMNGMHGVTLTEEEMADLEAKIRQVDSMQRKIIRQRDKECAVLLLDYISGDYHIRLAFNDHPDESNG